MNPLQKRVVELFAEDVSRWEKAAEDIKAILPNMAAPDREQWKAKAEAYRERLWHQMMDRTRTTRTQKAASGERTGLVA